MRLWPGIAAGRKIGAAFSPLMLHFVVVIPVGFLFIMVVLFGNWISWAESRQAELI
jgi:hypothetical protein